MSTLYIANTSQTASRGVWYGSPSTEKYSYESFIPGEDVNLDKVSVYINPYLIYTPPTNFTVSLYSDGSGSSTPGSLITTLSGPSTPTGTAYNDYVSTSQVSLEAGSKYWLGFQLSSQTGDGDNTRVRLGVGSSGFSTLGSGWSVPNHLGIDNGVTDTNATPVVYSLYATSRAVCFCRGTLIQISSGENVPIEKLQIGSLVATSQGSLPIKWIARRTIRKTALDKYHYWHALPIKIERGSIAPGVPESDLYVSGSHGIYVDGRIVCASFLDNAISIKRASLDEFRDCVDYFHLEFADEVLVSANGLLCCSYVNERNRRTFDNYPEFIRLYVDVDSTVTKKINTGPRNLPSIAGHKHRVMRTWLAAV